MKKSIITALLLAFCLQAHAEDTADGKAQVVNITDGASQKNRTTVFKKTNSNALAVAIIDSSGDPIASFGGGTQYAEGATVSTATGTAFLWKGPGNTMTTVTAANPLPVSATLSLGTGSTIKIADLSGNVYPATIPVSLASVPSHAVTNAGVFATQDTPATNATMKMASSLGNVFTEQSIGPSHALDVNIRAGTPTTMTVTQGTGTNLHAVLDANSGVDIGRLTSNQTVNVSQINGLSPAMNSGTATAGTLQVVIATPSSIRIFDSTGNTITAAAGSLQVFVATPSSIRMFDSTGNTISASGGNLNIFAATNTTMKMAGFNGNVFTNTQKGDRVALDVNVVSGTPATIQTVVGVNGGWLAATESTLSTVAQQVKGSAGNFGGYTFYNPNSSVAYLQFFDSATAGGCTLTTLKVIMGIPATSAANIEFGQGISFTNGIYATSATSATGNTANSTPLAGSILYK